MGQRSNASLGGGIALRLGLAHPIPRGGDIDYRSVISEIGHKQLGQIEGSHHANPLCLHEFLIVLIYSIPLLYGISTDVRSQDAPQRRLNLHALVRQAPLKHAAFDNRAYIRQMTTSASIIRKLYLHSSIFINRLMICRHACKLFSNVNAGDISLQPLCNDKN